MGFASVLRAVAYPFYVITVLLRLFCFLYPLLRTVPLCVRKPGSPGCDPKELQNAVVLWLLIVALWQLETVYTFVWALPSVYWLVKPAVIVWLCNGGAAAVHSAWEPALRANEPAAEAKVLRGERWAAEQLGPHARKLMEGALAAVLRQGRKLYDTNQSVRQMVDRYLPMLQQLSQPARDAPADAGAAPRGGHVAVGTRGSGERRRGAERDSFRTAERDSAHTADRRREHDERGLRDGMGREEQVWNDAPRPPPPPPPPPPRDDVHSAPRGDAGEWNDEWERRAAGGGGRGPAGGYDPGRADPYDRRGPAASAGSRASHHDARGGYGAEQPYSRGAPAYPDSGADAPLRRGDSIGEAVRRRASGDGPLARQHSRQSQDTASTLHSRGSDSFQSARAGSGRFSHAVE